MKIDKTEKLKEQADTLGEQYTSLGERMAALKAQQEKHRDAIVELGIKHGNLLGATKSKVIEGDRYVVGATVRGGDDVLDLELLKQVLPPKLLKKAMVKKVVETEEIDLEKVKAMIDLGDITEEMSKKFIVPTTPSFSVYCKVRKDK